MNDIIKLWPSHKFWFLAIQLRCQLVSSKQADINILFPHSIRKPVPSKQSIKIISGWKLMLTGVIYGRTYYITILKLLSKWQAPGSTTWLVGHTHTHTHTHTHHKHTHTPHSHTHTTHTYTPHTHHTTPHTHTTHTHTHRWWLTYNKRNIC